MTILITGGTGKTSLPLAALLKENGVPFLLASRSGSAPEGLKGCRFDWFDESTYENPFKAASDITAMYIVAPEALDILTLTKAFVDYALGKGVKRFVLLSASLAECGGPAHGQVHEYIKSLDVEYGVVRPTWFMQNFSESQHLAPIRNEGKVYSATGNGKVPFVSTEDIARVAQRLLLDQKPHNTDYVVLGPDLLSYDDVVKILTEVLGKPIDHVKLSGEGLAQWMESIGVSPEIARFLADLDVQIGSSRVEERLNTNVKDLTGKDPVSFRAFVEANKAVWL